LIVRAVRGNSFKEQWDVKKQLILALAGCMPLIATADILGHNLGFADASTTVIVALGIVALIAARRFQKN